MTEKQEQLQVYLKLLCVCICAGLYSWGGLQFRIPLRVPLSGLFCVASMAYFSKDWRALLCLPLVGALSLPYGSAILLKKILLRLSFSSAVGLSGSILNLTRHKWLLFALHCIILIIAYILVGVFSPFGSARTEETFLGFLCFAIPILSAKPRQ